MAQLQQIYQAMCVFWWVLGIGLLILITALYAITKRKVREAFPHFYKCRNEVTKVILTRTITAVTREDEFIFDGYVTTSSKVFINKDDYLIYVYARPANSDGYQYEATSILPYVSYSISSRPKKSNAVQTDSLGAMLVQVLCKSPFRNIKSVKADDILIPSKADKDASIDNHGYLMDGVVRIGIPVYVYPHDMNRCNAAVMSDKPYIAVFPYGNDGAYTTYLCCPQYEATISVDQCSSEIDKDRFLHILNDEINGKATDGRATFYEAVSSKNPNHYRLPIFKDIIVY